MSFNNAVVSVGTTATLLTTGVTDTHVEHSRTIAVYNDGASTVYLGGSTVTTTNGFPLAAASSIEFDLDTSSGDLPYGIVASGTVSCRVLHLGV